MRVISAYLLAVLGGNASPSADDINKILSSVGVEAPADRVEALISELSGKDLETVLAEGRSKLAALPSGGGGGGGGSSAPAAGGAAPAAAAAAPKKEEKKEESEEEDMGFSLFD